MKDLKYLFAYTIPVSAYISFTSHELGTYTAVIYAFIIIPFLDSIFGQSFGLGWTYMLTTFGGTPNLFDRAVVLISLHDSNSSIVNNFLCTKMIR